MSDWQSGVCVANGINIHYTRSGGEKPPLLLLHGLMTNGLCWTGLARALAADYDLIMPDARGHGGSGVPEFGYRYADHADDAAALIAALGLQAPILCGHSMGGLVATVVASRQPALLRALVLIDPTYLSPAVQREVRDSDVAEQHRLMRERSLDELVADQRRRHPRRSAENHELYARARLQTSMAALDVLTPPNPDFRLLIPQIELPCLLVISDHGLVTPGLAAELQDLNPRLQTAQVHQAGHNLHIDQPQQFLAILEPFLRSL